MNFYFYNIALSKLNGTKKISPPVLSHIPFHGSNLLFKSLLVKSQYMNEKKAKDFMLILRL
jgi:hypothetical protein